MSTVKAWETLAVESGEDGVLWIYFNRPEKRNAMNPTLHREMVELLEEVSTDDSVNVVVLTGAGEAFSAGQDIKEMFKDFEGKASEQAAVARMAHHWRYELLAHYPKVTIAMVNGWCCGGALTPAIACDFALASEEALFCVSEVNWGIIPGGLVAKMLTDSLGYRDALYYSLVAEPFDGRKAAEIGLVNVAVPEMELRSETQKLAEKLMSKNLAAVRATKEALRAVRTMDMQQAEEYLLAKHHQLQLLDTDQGQSKGIERFLGEKFRPGLGSYKEVDD
jgi:feruloyl-CoA hydratase/lyase